METFKIINIKSILVLKKILKPNMYIDNNRITKISDKNVWLDEKRYNWNIIYKMIINDSFISVDDKINFLENIIDDNTEKKHWNSFEKQSRYVGNGIYSWRNILSTDTRELFLLGISLVEFNFLWVN